MAEQLWDLSVDFLCIGSGAAGLSGAYTAARAGASALVLEATDKIGGATAFSGAVLWAPFNRWARAAGGNDMRASAEAYIEACIGERAHDPRWKVFLNDINDFIEDVLVRECGMQFDLMRYPDSYGERPNGRTDRHLNARAYPLSRAGPWAKYIRTPAVAATCMLTLRDLEAVGFVNPRGKAAVLGPRILGNLIRGRRGMGVGLVTALVGACVRRNVEFQLNTRVVDLVISQERVTGVIAEQAGRTLRIGARRGVLLATGGFSWNAELVAAHIASPYDLPQDPPTSLGDGVRLAQRAGAELRYLDETWALPSSPVRSGRYMDRALGQPIIADRTLPHSMWVNGQGVRFVNEGGQNAAEAFRLRDADGRLANMPCFCIYDQNYRDKYPLLVDFAPGKAGPPELVSAASLRELADKIGVSADALEASAQRFSAFARAGSDGDFGRGEGAYERYFVGAEGNLGVIEKPPFYALPVASSGVGTKGGAMTDIHSQVLRANGDVINNFYAAGNASAAFNGPITVAAGCTIPPALVMGAAAARHACGRAG